MVHYRDSGEGEFSSNGYHDLLGQHAIFAEHTAAVSSATHPCPYIAYVGPIHPSSLKLQWQCFRWNFTAKSAYAIFSTQAIFLPVVGLVDPDKLKPGDLVGASKDSYLILDTLPSEYDSRVKAMEVDEKPTEDYNDIGSLEKQVDFDSKVIPNLEELSLNVKDAAKVSQGQFSADLFHRLRVLELQCFDSAEFPFGILHRFQNMEKLVVTTGYLKELLPCQLVDEEEHTLARIRCLELFCLPYMEKIWNQDLRADQLLQNLETLEVRFCDNLINFAPSASSFGNLTALEVEDCKALKYLVTSSTARSLVQLSVMSIKECKMVTEIVASNGDEAGNEIIFRKLESLKLDCLASLTSFCSLDFTFRFPRLTEVIVTNCPKMKTFSLGILSTPKLRKTIFLPVVGLVDPDKLKPGDLVGVTKDSYLILDTLPSEYDSRVKAMEVDEKPTEDYNDSGGLEKQFFKYHSSDHPFLVFLLLNKGRTLAMEILSSMTSTVVELLFDPIFRSVSRVFNYSRNVKNLETRMEELSDKKTRVLHSVEEATNKTEVIHDDVEKWLASVDGITEEADRVLKDEDKAENRCLMGLFPNLMTRYRVSTEIESIEEKAVKISLRGKFDRVSYLPARRGIGDRSVKDYEAFESRRHVLDDILEALKDNDVNLVGVYGMPGVGKTTIVKKVAEQVKANKIFDVVVLAVVSKTPNLREIQGEIADGLGFKFEAETNRGRAERLHERLKSETKVCEFVN
ncbi:hypothetical protein DKX38_019304 [Salix brachista]|uniref:NB-ARC domain-containing protein n=1 Tax=Salix brachista TaxID=2182728 RepID=A0A5N5KFW1_9ROSI|nr:hypothetical protein DKX38_019304 [Salix brachista]